jgi:uncharacterized protein (TIGR03435 family)
MIPVLLAITLLAEPRFEVASVRPRTTSYGRIDITTSGNRLTAEAETALGLIFWAYDLKSYQVPDRKGLDDTVYDIAAKAGGDATPSKAEFRQMLQALLEERFHLKVHREMREMPVYALVVGKGGPKFHESADDVIEGANIGVHGRSQKMDSRKVSMDVAAERIRGTFFIERPVLNRTGLTGLYDIQMERMTSASSPPCRSSWV